jgi:hypothetical protein
MSTIPAEQQPPQDAPVKEVYEVRSASPPKSKKDNSRRHTLGGAQAYGATRDSLRTLLAQSDRYEAFLEYSKSQYCAENVLFYKRATSLHNMCRALHRYTFFHNTNTMPPEIQMEADNIYNEFIREEGEGQVNLTNGVIKEIERAFASGKQKGDVFEKAREEAFDLLYRHVYPKFLKHELSTVETVQTTTDVKLKKAPSGIRKLFAGIRNSRKSTNGNESE